jgi:SAM-dependent methyltransferase
VPPPRDPAASRFSDFRWAPNQAGRPDLYELENQATDPDGLVLAAMRRLAPWRGRILVDLGCGSGYWLPRYAAEAAAVIGIEPDPGLLRLAARRLAARPGPRVTVLPGSAEHLPLADASVDVVHARFAYFWPPRCGPGLAEVLRVLRPGGTLVVVDSDHRSGEFAELIRAAPGGAQGRAGVTDAWWAHRGADRVRVASRWQFASRADFEAVLRLEFPAGVAGRWLARHPHALGLSYGYVLFAVHRPGGPAAPRDLRR